jgi:hypothetical protein
MTHAAGPHTPEPCLQRRKAQHATANATDDAKHLARRPAHPVGSTIVTDQDFATTLRDGRRVIGRREGNEWSIHVYSPDRQSRLLGYGVAATRPDALERAGVTGEDAAEVLGRIGI